MIIETYIYIYIYISFVSRLSGALDGSGKTVPLPNMEIYWAG